MYTKIFQVAGTASGKKAPKPDATVTVGASGVTLPKIGKGDETLLLKNDDSKDHELIFIRIPSGKSAQDLQTLFGGNEPPKPPYGNFGFLGGPMKVAKGSSVTYTTSFKAGSYVVGDPNAQPPLFKEFKVS
jgi:hypothetical protein